MGWTSTNSHNKLKWTSKPTQLSPLRRSPLLQTPYKFTARTQTAEAKKRGKMLPRPKTEPLSPSSNSPPAVRRNSPPTQFLESRVKSEPRHSDDDDPLAGSNNADDNHGHRVKSETQQEEEEEPETGRRGAKRLRTGPSGGASSFRGKHRRRLEKLLRRFMHEHRWNEAAGVVSVLIRGAPPGKLADDDELRRYYTVAMELHRRFINKEDRKYDQWIKQIYDMWMASFSRSYDDSRKKNAILMEFALFHFTQGNIGEAYSNMQYVIQDDELSKDPLANLLHGMILYQLWYSGLPEEIRIKGFDKCMPMGTPGVASDNGYREMEIGENSNNYYAATTHVKFSSQCASESSFGNDKVIKGCNNYRSKTEPGHAHWPQEFYGSHSTAKNRQNCGSFNLDDNLQNSSIFFAHGLDTVLLPIHLEHFTGGIDQIIYQYRRLADGNYIDAVKHLRLALHSVRPLSAALFPLIQLLLLGDRVEEAFKELETSCHNVDSALPFRLMARLLECFQRNKITMICSYYENALKRDPICYLSLERLVKMHKSGNYSTLMMFEMIALHLDAADGQCSIWEEFASCFLQFLIVVQSEYEDCTSKNLERGGTKTVSSSKFPVALARESGPWKLRFEWWKRRHFRSSSLQENASDSKLLCFKAACASHIYGPMHEYVVKVFNILKKEDDEHCLILNTHIQQSMDLLKHL